MAPSKRFKITSPAGTVYEIDDAREASRLRARGYKVERPTSKQATPANKAASPANKTKTPDSK